MPLHCRRWLLPIGVVLLLGLAGCVTTPAPTPTDTTPGGMTPAEATPADIHSDARIVAYYPSESGTYVNETVATGASFVEVGAVERGPGGQYFVPATLNESAAETFAATMVEHGYANGTHCSFTSYANVSGRCLLTVDDGDVLYSAGIAPSLGESFANGDFVADPRFRLTVQSETAGERLRCDLEAAR
jgi:preprotein translocase subunit SecD